MKHLLLAACAAMITIVSAQAVEIPKLTLAQFKGDCFNHKGKLKPADYGRWVCFLPDGTLKVST